LGLKFVTEPTFGLSLEAVQRDWRSEDVAGKAFYAISVQGVDRNVSMETHAPFTNTTLSGADIRSGTVFPGLRWINAIAESSPRLSCFRSGSDARANGSSDQSSKQGIIAGQGVLLALQTSLFKKPHDAPRGSCHDASDVVGCGRRQWEEGPGGMGRASIHAVQYDAVKMWVRVESGTKSLNCRY